MRRMVAELDFLRASLAIHRHSPTIQLLVAGDGKTLPLDSCGVPVLGIYAIDARSKGIYIDPKLGTLLCIWLARTYSIG